MLKTIVKAVRIVTDCKRKMTLRGHSVR